MDHSSEYFSEQISISTKSQLGVPQKNRNEEESELWSEWSDYLFNSWPSFTPETYSNSKGVDNEGNKAGGREEIVKIS